MKRGFKTFICSLIALTVSVWLVIPASAADASVIYDGDAQKFIFAPGSSDSPTDLFDSFKGVMPGDALTQKITVRNAASNKVKVKLYLRSLGAPGGRGFSFSNAFDGHAGRGIRIVCRACQSNGRADGLGVPGHLLFRS